MWCSMKHSRLLALSAAAGAVLTSLPTGRLAAQAAERFQVSGDRVAVYNVAGVATLIAGTGSAVVVEVTRGGKDAARLKVEQGSIDGVATLRVLYPDDEIVYDPANAPWHGSSETRVRDDGTFGGGEGGRRVRIRSSGSGMEAWSDLRIAVPRGQRLNLHLAVGEMSVTNVNGALSLDGGATKATTTGTSGSLSIDVGSGDVHVTNASGDVSVDTGSGDVWVDGAGDGDLSVDTGSGNVSLGRVGAATVRLDTGSGTIDGVQVTADNLSVDTGSGDVTISFDGTPRSLDVDTGSGAVALTFPTGYSATVDLETSSGDLTVDFPLRINARERDRLRGVIGSGVGRLRVETGSGGIQIKQR
jgi:lia operon protein LiaG